MTVTAQVVSFSVAALVVVMAGTVLARSGDVIAARTKLGGAWVGSVFLALATSLPEIVTDISAVDCCEPCVWSTKSRSPTRKALDLSFVVGIHVQK